VLIAVPGTQLVIKMEVNMTDKFSIDKAWEDFPRSDWIVQGNPEVTCKAFAGYCLDLYTKRLKAILEKMGERE
jgi:hypothetical protein